MFFSIFNKQKKIKPSLSYFCFSVVEHCNLNCKYCDHFVPLAKEGYADINILEKHFTRLSELVELKSLGIMGGEPLLTPNLTDFFIMLRRVFPHTLITMYTNGILLNEQNDTFWETCKENRINIRISKFPLDINFDEVFIKSKEYKVPVEFYGSKPNEFKTMYKMALDIKGKQNIKEMYKTCWHNKGGCTYFADGKIYQCTTVGNIHNFNNHFNTNLKVTPKDYIDIYKITDGKKILTFLKKPIPFCKYCNIEKREYNLPFEISKKDIKEWSY